MKDGKFWVDLGWHGDPDTSIPPIGFSSYEEDIEILTPEEQAARAGQGGGLETKSREDLMEELAALRAEHPAAEPVNPEVAALRTELEQEKRNRTSGLTLEQLQAFAQLQGQPQQAKRETDAEFAEWVKEKLFDNPTAVLDEYMARKLSPEIRRLATNNQYQSRRFLELDPDKGATYKKYKAQIDAVVETLPPEEKLYNPEVYLKAYNQVITSNIDDIIATKVAEALANAANPAAGKVNPLTGQARHHSETGTMPNPVGGGQRKAVVLTRDERASAAMRGVSPEALAQYKLRHPEVK